MKVFEVRLSEMGAQLFPYTKSHWWAQLTEYLMKCTHATVDYILGELCLSMKENPSRDCWGMSSLELMIWGRTWPPLILLWSSNKCLVSSADATCPRKEKMSYCLAPGKWLGVFFFFKDHFIKNIERKRGIVGKHVQEDGHCSAKCISCS